MSEKKCILSNDNNCDCNEKRKEKKKCFECKKKVGFLGIECRCGNIFCNLHRYPENHNCSFDFKSHDRNELRKVVVGGGHFEKIEKI